MVLFFCGISAIAQIDGVERDYFSDAIAKNYAIAAARYAEKAHFYTRDIHQDYQRNRTYLVKSRHNADTARFYVKKALLMANQAIEHADTNKKALGLLYTTKNYLNEANANLMAIYKTTRYDDTHYYGEQAMYANGYAVVDAYHASLLLGDNLLDTNKRDLIVEDLLDIPLPENATRLEADEATFTGLINLYEERIVVLEQEAAALEKDMGSNTASDAADLMKEQVARLEEEKALLEEKLLQANEQLKTISELLSQVLLKDVDMDKVKPSRETQFETNKRGAVNDNNSIPFAEELPGGLIYRVQIGYYPASKKVKFPGLHPVSKVKVSRGYIRYFTGYFKTYAEATKAKTYIRQNIVKDAFVVSYFERKKISSSEAMRIEHALQIGTGE